jgi:hypothetical protein
MQVLVGLDHFTKQAIQHACTSVLNLQFDYGAVLRAAFLNGRQLWHVFVPWHGVAVW